MASWPVGGEFPGGVECEPADVCGTGVGELSGAELLFEFWLSLRLDGAVLWGECGLLQAVFDAHAPADCHACVSATHSHAHARVEAADRDLDAHPRSNSYENLHAHAHADKHSYGCGLRAAELLFWHLPLRLDWGFLRRECALLPTLSYLDPYSRSNAPAYAHVASGGGPKIWRQRHLLAGL